MKEKCASLGHDWIAMAAPGWFRCQRIIDLKTSKHTPVGQFVYCGAVAYCPGCLGCRFPGRDMVACQAHVGIDIQTLPRIAAPPGQASYTPPPAKQQTMW